MPAFGRGARRSTVEQYLREVIAETVEILPYTREAAEWHADERARLEHVGRPPSFVDGQIAAIASVGGLVLVTRNTRDFAGFRDLTVENWFA